MLSFGDDPSHDLRSRREEKAMRMRDALPGRYLTGDDLDGDVTVTIERVVLESFRDPKTRQEARKPVMYFQRAKRGLIVNRTNWRTIADLYGDESDNWTGKRITLFSLMVDAYGRQTKAVRVRPARPAPVPAAEPAETAAAAAVAA
jgi:hypothetical protein